MDFVLEDESYLGLSSTVLRQNVVCYTADLDGNGTADLVYGDQSGRISIVSNFVEAGDASGAVSQLIFNPCPDIRSWNLGAIGRQSSTCSAPLVHLSLLGTP